jgi:magnesium chelatase family protein
MAEEAKAAGAQRLLVAEANGTEAALVEGLEVFALERLEQLPPALAGDIEALPATPMRTEEAPEAPDIADLRGQPALRRALEIAAAGGHSLLLVGPPGAGKSLAARRLPSLLPPLHRADALEVARIASVAGNLNGSVTARRPFRAPHHSVSPAGLVGGGNPPRAGEVTLAHRGVLFLDELGEFGRASLESLRAAGGGHGYRHPRGALRSAALPVHARRRREPVSMRARRGRRWLPVHAARGAPL